MRVTRESGIPFLIIGVGLGLVAGLLWASRSRFESWDQMRHGASDGLDYLSKEGEKVRASADELVGKTREWIARFGQSLRGAKHRRNANSGESPEFD